MIDIEALLPEGYPIIPAVIADLGATINRVAEALERTPHSPQTEKRTIYIDLGPPSWSVDETALRREILTVCMNETLKFSRFPTGHTNSHQPGNLFSGSTNLFASLLDEKRFTTKAY